MLFQHVLQGKLKQIKMIRVEESHIKSYLTMVSKK